MALYKQPYGSVMQNKGKERVKKFSVKLTEDEMNHPDIKAVSNYTPVKSGKFLDGTKNVKLKFEVPKKDFKSNQTYKDLRVKGRFQKAANTIGVIGLGGILGGFAKTLEK